MYGVIHDEHKSIIWVTAFCTSYSLKDRFLRLLDAFGAYIILSYDGVCAYLVEDNTVS